MVRPVRYLRAHGPRFAAAAAGLLFAFYAPGAIAEDVLIGMNDVRQTGGPDELVRIDRSTGVAVRLHVFTATNFNLLESLAWDARESVLWTTNDNVLLRIQTSNFAATTIGPVSVADIDGLAIQPSTGALFAITYGGNDILRIDKTDASALILNGHLEEGSRLEDLAFDPTERLYVLTSRALVEVNPVNGARISKVTLSGATSLEGLIWDPERNTFLSAADRGSYKDLVTIDRTNGHVAFVSADKPSGFRDIEALALVPASNIVPVAMQALASNRDASGVDLAWESFETGIDFVVQRAPSNAGPWLELEHVRQPTSGRPGAWQYTHHDAAAADPQLATASLSYRVGAADASGVWSWLQFEIAAAPRVVTLHPNMPNPFNPTTSFVVELAAPSRLELSIFDVRGRLVYSLAEHRSAGRHALVWDGRDQTGQIQAGGVYPYILTAGGHRLSGRAVLVK